MSQGATHLITSNDLTLKPTEQARPTFPMTLPQIPEDAIDIIRQASEDEANAIWTIGDTINLLAEELPYPKTLILQRIALETGLDETTLRDKAWLASNITEKNREDYPILTPSQWRACLSAGDDYEQVAHWASVDYPNGQGNGRPASCKKIRSHIANGDDDAEQGTTTYMLWARKTETLFEDGLYDNRLPSWMRNLYSKWYVEFQAERQRHEDLGLT